MIIDDNQRVDFTTYFMEFVVLFLIFFGFIMMFVFFYKAKSIDKRISSFPLIIPSDMKSRFTYINNKTIKLNLGARGSFFKGRWDLHKYCYIKFKISQGEHGMVSCFGIVPKSTSSTSFPGSYLNSIGYFPLDGRIFKDGELILNCEKCVIGEIIGFIFINNRIIILKSGNIIYDTDMRLSSEFLVPGVYTNSNCIIWIDSSCNIPNRFINTSNIHEPDIIQHPPPPYMPKRS